MESAVNALVRAGERRAARRQVGLPAHLTTGLRGERAAFFWLRRHGYIVVARQWRSSRAPGDLDLIAWLPGSEPDRRGDTLCFVEVKTRTTRAVAPAQLAVDRRKRRVLRRLARHYLRQLPHRDVPTRFDILSIYFEKDKPVDCEYFPGAFAWEETR
jgi:putative endonuclease